MPRYLRAIVALCLALAGCRSHAPTGPSASASARILFIGNSYTYSADIPGIVQGLGDALGDSLYVETVAGPNMALIDHWNDGAALDAVRARRWDIVVLQQGPSSVEVNRDTLRLAVQLFAPEIRAAGGRPALFSAWPAESRLQDFPRAIDSYRIAAEDVDGVLLPVAAAWLDAWQRDATLRLYDDGLHPSIEGAYLSALVIYGALRSRSPRQLPFGVVLRSGSRVQVSAPAGATLQAAAAAVLGYP